MDTVHGDSSSKHRNDEQVHPTLGNKPEIDKVTPSSSSGWEAFGQDLFNLDAAEPHKSFLQSTEIASDKLASQSKTQNDKVTGTNDVGTNDNLDIFGPNHSPPLEVMKTSKFSNPNKLESSMSNATDLSVFSNESLFSIQLRSSSPSSENVLLGRPPDGTNFPMDPYSPSLAKVANAAVMQDVLKVNAEKVGGKDHKHPAGCKHHSAPISDRFNNGITSFSSFAFPILTKKSGLVNVEPVNQMLHWKQAPQPPAKTKTQKATLAAKWISFFSRPCCS